MTKQLRLEEMRDCLIMMGENLLAQQATTILEGIGTIMAKAIADRLDVWYDPAVCESEAFAGCCAGFRPKYSGQKCPAPLSDFDPAEWETE